MKKNLFLSVVLILTIITGCTTSVSKSDFLNNKEKYEQVKDILIKNEVK